MLAGRGAACVLPTEGAGSAGWLVTRELRVGVGGSEVERGWAGWQQVE